MINELMKKFAAAGQAHVLAHVDSLSTRELSDFVAQLESVDFGWVDARHRQYGQEKNGAGGNPDISPALVIALPKTPEEKRAATEALALGEEALRAGRLAAFLVAGGQGTRLGFPGPKGCYPIGPITSRSLFQWHAEQIRARGDKYGTIIPWYIMTSSANDKDTQYFFEENKFFGLNEADVRFFSQAMVPALDFEGKLLLAGPGQLAMSPNGHGGSLKALVDSGATADMRARGVDLISYFQVDNPLTTICDPLFAGYHFQACAQMSSKVVAKRDPQEKVGVVAIVDGKCGVVEYSDLGVAESTVVDENGRLQYWAGSIAIHMLNVDFAEKVGGGGALPWHVAIKKVPFLGGDGQLITPDKPNGVKFETFVFDALPLAEVSITMEVAREEEFAPVKNSQGEDSAESCRALMSAYAARMLEQGGGKPGENRVIEMSPLFALDADQVRRHDLIGLSGSTPLILEP